MIQERYVNMLEDSIKKNWELPALSNYQGANINYGEMGEKILWLHNVYEKNHVKKGDKIAVIGKNSVNWGLVYLSAISYGAVIVPILPDFKPDDIQHIVNHSDSVLFFAAESIFENIDESKMPHLTAIVSLENFAPLYTKKNDGDKVFKESAEYKAENLSAESFALPDIQNDVLSAIVYTSGTTGFSKGVMLPQNSLSANVRYAQNNIPLKFGDKIVSFMPLAHSYGCAFEFLYPLSIGCHVTMLSKIPSPKIIVKAFQEVRPQLILSVPLVIEKIYKKQLMPVLSKPSMKIMLKLPIISKKIHAKIRQKLVDVFGGKFIEIVIGGAAFNPEVEEFLNKIGFPYTSGYGMTECGPLISYDGYKSTKMFSVGLEVDTLDVKIDSEDPANVVGEILVKGENVMTGYYKNEEATREAIDSDGWLHTGDLGVIDSDGYIFIKGRSKNMILGASGQNIYPEEMEARLNNMTYVNESLVLGKGGKLVALVHPDMEAVDASKIDETKLAEKMEENRKALNAGLSAYMQISKIELYPEEFEKTPTKKIKRFMYNV
jgi:long-chain acyl-CoA synthetase